MLQGNFYLFNGVDIDSPFFIMDENDAAQLKLYKIKLPNDLVVNDIPIGISSTDYLIKEYADIKNLDLLNTSNSELKNPKKDKVYSTTKNDNFENENNLTSNKNDKEQEEKNKNQKATIDILKEAISFAEDKQRLKAILTETKQKAKILNIIKMALSSLAGRIIFYFILIGLIPVPDSFTITNGFMIIYILLSVIIGYIDQFKIYATILKKTNLAATVDKNTIRLKEKNDKAAKKYNENIENYNMLTTLLGDKYGKIKVAKYILYFLQSGKAATLEEAKALYDKESKEQRDRTKREALTLGALALGALFIMCKIIGLAMSETGKRNDWWW